MIVANLETFPGMDECVFCFGKVRVAKRIEVEARLRMASPDFRAVTEQQPGTWYICPRCGPESAVRWQSISWDEDEP
jgi:hypothetical protein